MARPRPLDGDEAADLLAGGDVPDADGVVLPRRGERRGVGGGRPPGGGGGGAAAGRCPGGRGRRGGGGRGAGRRPAVGHRLSARRGQRRGARPWGLGARPPPPPAGRAPRPSRKPPAIYW